jgi:hypothetical protein
MGASTARTVVEVVTAARRAGLARQIVPSGAGTRVVSTDGADADASERNPVG